MVRADRPIGAPVEIAFGNGIRMRLGLGSGIEAVTATGIATWGFAI